MKKTWKEPTILIVKERNEDVILASLQETGVNAGGWYNDDVIGGGE